MMYATTPYKVGADGTHTLKLSADALLGYASATELDFKRAYEVDPFTTAVVICAKASIALLAAGAFALPFMVLGGAIFAVLDHADEVVPVLAVAWALLFAGVVIWRNAVAWSRRRPHPRERPSRDMCWDVLVQLLGRCAAEVPEEAELTLVMGEIDHQGWSWSLTVPLEASGAGAVAVVHAGGDGGERCACRWTTPAGHTRHLTAARRSPTTPWTLDGAPVDDLAASLAEQIWATVRPCAAQDTLAAAPRWRFAQSRGAPRPKTRAEETQGAWVLRDHAPVLELTQPSWSLGMGRLAFKPLHVWLQVAAAVGVVVLAASPCATNVVSYFSRGSETALFVWGALALCIIAPVMVWMDWENGAHLMPNTPGRAVRATSPGQRVFLRSGALTVGEDTIDLCRPFGVDMARDPGAQPERARVTVTLTQARDAEDTARVRFACAVRIDEAVASALPAQASTAPWLEDEALEAVWPVLVEHAWGHGERLPVLEACDDVI